MTIFGKSRDQSVLMQNLKHGFVKIRVIEKVMTSQNLNDVTTF